jgi:hypothetical protein
MTQTAEVPALTEQELSEMSMQEVKAHALRFYAAELDEGRDPSALDLAVIYTKTDRWARGIRSAVQAEREAETDPADSGTFDRATETTPAELSTPERQPAAAPETPTAVPTSADAGPGTDTQPETPAETTRVPAVATPETTTFAPEIDVQTQNLAPFAHEPAQEATRSNPRPFGQPDESSATEPHMAAPSWTVQDRAGDLTTETLTPPAVPVPALVPVPAPVAERPVATVESAPETSRATGTVEAPAGPAAETPAEGAERATDQEVSGRAVAWVAFATGIIASVAANVLHAADGGAAIPELVGAAFWPVALLLSVELLTRVAWPRGFWWGFGRYVGVGLVGLVAAVLSYRHMAGLLQMWGEDHFNAHLGPLAVDGLMLVAATALLAITHSQKATN